MTPAPLSGAQKTRLRGIGQTLPDTAFLGREGPTPAFHTELARLLESRGLVKLRFTGGQDRRTRAALCDRIAAECACDCVGAVGHTALFWRDNEAGKQLL